eukprot:1526195-Amphidinium_carterae.1
MVSCSTAKRIERCSPHSVYVSTNIRCLGVTSGPHTILLLRRRVLLLHDSRPLQDISAPSKSLGRKELSRSLTTSTTHLNRRASTRCADRHQKDQTVNCPNSDCMLAIAIFGNNGSTGLTC